MIESREQWTDFVVDTSRSDDLLFHVVPLHDGIHSAINKPSILFIRNLQKKQTFYISIDHPDVKCIEGLTVEKLAMTLSELGRNRWAIDKKALFHMIPVEGLKDVGLAGYLKTNTIFDSTEFDTVAHQLIRRNFMGRPGFGKFVPLMKHLEAFSEIVEAAEKIINKATLDDAFRSFNELIIEPLGEVELAGLAVNKSIFEEHFGAGLITSGFVFTQYNVYTATGRPSNRFGGVNYAALNKEDGSRKAFVSRFGGRGKLVLIDYSAFHPRIIAFLTKYPLKADVDIYEYLARLYFDKEKPDELDVADAKQITFRQLYGGVEAKYGHIKYLSHLKEFIDANWSLFNQYGYVETPLFKRRITDKHLTSPKPATVFNYILQAAEGEISISVLGKVNEFLRTKKTKAVLYTYDSILFDYCFDDDKATGRIIQEVKDIMSLDGTFPMKVYLGDDYHKMEVV